MITIVLMESENAGNMGAVARAMANFGSDKLILLSPKADPLSKEAQDRAKYAKSILKKAKVMPSSDFFKKEKKKFSILVGTSAKTGTSYNMKRNPLTPRQLAEHYASLPVKSNVAILLGREGIGLTNQEIERCDMLVTIPSSPEYPVLNVSAAATCILYEIFTTLALHGQTKHSMEYLVPPTQREREQLTLLAYDAISSLEFFTPQKYATQRIVWKKLFGKAPLSRREAYALMGFFRKAAGKAKKPAAKKK